MNIIDKRMYPYFINIKGDGNHDLSKFTGKVDAKGEARCVLIGHFNSVASAIYRLIKIKTTEGESTVDLDEYLKKLQTEINNAKSIKLT